MGAVSIANAVVSVLSIDSALGRTADDIAAALNLPAGGPAIQVQLEALVRDGVLNRRGVSHGALYTLATPSRAGRAPRVRARMITRRASRPVPRGALA